MKAAVSRRGILYRHDKRRRGPHWQPKTAKTEGNQQVEDVIWSLERADEGPIRFTKVTEGVNLFPCFRHGVSLSRRSMRLQTGGEFWKLLSRL